MVEFIGAQLGLSADDLVDYASREETRHEHLAELWAFYGFRTFSGRGARELKDCRTRIVLPVASMIERLCATALVDAELQIETRIAGRLSMPIREQLLALLEETADDRVTRFV